MVLNPTPTVLSVSARGCKFSYRLVPFPLGVLAGGNPVAAASALQLLVSCVLSVCVNNTVCRGDGCARVQHWPWAVFVQLVCWCVYRSLRVLVVGWSGLPSCLSVEAAGLAWWAGPPELGSLPPVGGFAIAVLWRAAFVFVCR